jgi:hypothetical protein
MAYRKINVELIVFADDAETVAGELNASLDRLEERHTICSLSPSPNPLIAFRNWSCHRSSFGITLTPYSQAAI